MKIGLYFGSFNPIHHGHLIVAQTMLQDTDLQEVWFVVSPQNPFKKATTLLNENHRFRLVELAIESAHGLRASKVEFKLPRPSYTVDTLTYLKEQYPQHEWVIIMGSDGFQNIQQWKNAEYLQANYSIYIYPRPGFTLENQENAKVKQIPAPLLEISSTHIRYLIAGRKSIRYLVPEKVASEITQQHYYQSALENPAKK
jgi:nicotinate-nucleotide adenylyltransferase